MYPYSAFDVSRYIVNSSIEAHEPVSNLQLQKILYFVQVNYCSAKSSFLFEDDFEAWQYGPVIPEIYRLFSIWGGGKITSPIPSDKGNAIASQDRAIIDPTIKACRKRAPWALVEEAHADGLPWQQTMQRYGDGGLISKDLILKAALR